MTPTREEQLAAIRDKCIAANPEILEIKFGCRVSKTHSVNENARYVTQSHGKIVSRQMEPPYNFIVHFDEDSCPYEQLISDENLTVFGREIRLSDVLLVAETSIKGCQLATETDGRFIDIADKTYDTPNKEFQNTGVKWNLRADDLDQQSDECVAFLHSLLV